MALTIAQRLERLKVRLDELFWWREREAVGVEGWTFDGAPIAIGAAWPRRDGVVTLAATAEAPAHWPLDETRLVLDLGGESLVSLGYPGGETVRFGHDPYHREFPLSAHAVSISSESVARLPFGEPVRRPCLNGARLVRLDLPVHQLHLRLKQVAEACGRYGQPARGTNAAARRAGSSAIRAQKLETAAGVGGYFATGASWRPPHSAQDPS